MALCKNWEVVVNRFSSKFSLWKARLLSVGGRLTLLKSVLGNLPTYFMSLYLMPVSIRSKLESLRSGFFNGSDSGDRKIAWVSWKTCLASKETGGLGLLFKWIWRFLHNHSDLWVHVIKGIYGRTGGIFDTCIHSSSLSPWRGILSMVKSIKLKGVDLLSLCRRKLGNGETVLFWDDCWCGDQSLKSKFPRIYLLDNDKGCNVANRLSLPDWGSVLRRNPRGGIEASQFTDLRLLIEPVVLNPHRDTWTWSLGVHKGFSVASIRSLIDLHFLGANLNATRWNHKEMYKYLDDTIAWMLGGRTRDLYKRCKNAKVDWISI
ncbi:RNA-directed DNA polymerase, eukaryota, Reverse transcriptase zinc-binding domain protein [Artemisia annua]|uniref:RNA-directed DNA polymerase, eukaryota, Reverse transcriptase zinc-binding domain protein n=1 Tax=Artemisia annua TaxID=35608 RepID=A0A2U1LYE1_ARTAN|nr:RNA-directed DNA polymerase, eukaryota, Reverse transcriptase zinc-binding domain protein [Artemisia annua]